MSRVETAGGTTKEAMENVASLRVLEQVAEELRRHGVRARVRHDYRGIPDIYIDYDDLDKLFRLCDEGGLSKEARELLC